MSKHLVFSEFEWHINATLHSVKSVIPGENYPFEFSFISTAVAQRQEKTLKVCQHFTHESLVLQPGCLEPINVNNLDC